MARKTVLQEQASKGGKARAASLTAEERSSIAKAAVEARWRRTGQLKNPVRKATHEGELRIGEIIIPCAVLDDQTRVLSRAGFVRAIGRKGKAKGGGKYDDESKTPVFLTAKNLKPFIPNDLGGNSTPIPFIPSSGGLPQMGYRADFLHQVCSVFLDAGEAGALNKTQLHIAARCKILIRGLAIVGITALVDEATGFQAVRERDALARILEAFVSKELRKWVKTFPPEYYQELCRLKGVEYPPQKKTFPQYFGHLTNDIVYDRLAPGVKDELQRKNPVVDHKHRRHKHHQHLTPNVGHPALREHLWAATALMKASDDWPQFKRAIDRALPVHVEIAMPLWEDQGVPLGQSSSSSAV